MNKIAIIIPSRLDAQRLPNKPLKLINNKEIILHVYDQAIKSKAGEVYVATPDEKIFDTVKNSGGNAIKTSDNHETGTDRIFEVFKKKLNSEPEIVINLQGDMPNIQPQAISDLVSYMQKKKCDIGTLASEFNSKTEINNPNVVKVAVKEKLLSNKFLNVFDFFRIDENSAYNLYHHIGIYAFTNKALIRYVSLKRSKLELERKLEQLRALENKMSIHVGYIKSSPLSVDTEEDLAEVKNLMEKNEKN
ncbi:3-deoxy-manno-octulosonate cytidylyltransferase [Pelagibacterales bacterium SAG-MED05]|nr:3-deoxy-manno-octulosonate cytidylyltransferase [Pelagibacterales bacterium SAG-MED05]